MDTPTFPVPLPENLFSPSAFYDAYSHSPTIFPSRSQARRGILFYQGFFPISSLCPPSHLLHLGLMGNPQGQVILLITSYLLVFRQSSLTIGLFIMALSLAKTH